MKPHVYESFSTIRSGHHSVLYWLVHQHKQIWEEKAPFIETAGNIAWDYGKYSLIIKDNLYKDRYPTLLDNDLLDYTTHYKCLHYIVAREEHDFSNNYNKDLRQLFRKSTIKNIIILRDYHNTIASLLQFGAPEKLYAVKNLWKILAEEFIGITNNVKNKYGISYNSYIESIDYRKQVCKDLKLDFTDLYFDYVTPQGNGSSFSKRSKINKRDLLYRYRHVLDHPTYRDFMKISRNEQELSQYIFNNQIVI